MEAKRDRNEWELHVSFHYELLFLDAKLSDLFFAKLKNREQRLGGLHLLLWQKEKMSKELEWKANQTQG